MTQTITTNIYTHEGSWIRLRLPTADIGGTYAANLGTNDFYAGATANAGLDFDSRPFDGVDGAQITGFFQEHQFVYFHVLTDAANDPGEEYHIEYSLTGFDNLGGFHDLVWVWVVTIDPINPVLSFQGGAGNDIYLPSGQPGDHWLDGGGGRNTLDYSAAPGAVAINFATGKTTDNGFLGIDSFTNFHNAIGSAFNDVIVGGAGANRIEGRAGADTLSGGGGNDVLDGGAGADTMNGGAGNDLYFIDDAGDVATETGLGTDTVRATVSVTLGPNVENLVLVGAGAINGIGNTLNNAMTGGGGVNMLSGGGGDDTLDGMAGADRLNGGPGDDVLIGGGGGDLLIGGGGADNLSGGLGADAFLFNAPLDAIDTIADFNVVDVVRLDDAVFTALAPLGALTAAAFHIGAVAADADDRIIYDAVTGALFYDSDGVGGAAQIQFAALTAGLALSAADFVVI